MGKIRNKSFQYGEKKYLRMGDGLPIVLDLLNGGELQIEFEYEINRLIDAKGSLNEIILDVKKSNFYDTASGVINFRCTKSLQKKLIAIAKKENVSLSHIVNDALVKMYA